MTLLVVEDEYLILDFICTEMADAGITSIGATTPDEAMRILQANPAITALVTDINMPGSIDGLKLARWVRQRWPSMRLWSPAEGKRLNPMNCLKARCSCRKPFFPEQILGAIQRTN